MSDDPTDQRVLRLLVAEAAAEDEVLERNTQPLDAEQLRVDVDTSVTMTRQQFVLFLDWAHRSGWVSDIVCATHDGLPDTEEERALWEEGQDPCASAVRIWER